MRLFAAVVPPLELREEIASTVARAGSRVATRWTPAANLHLTLAFLGEVPPERLSQVQGAAASAAAAVARFELAMQGLGAFDSLARARVLFLRAVAGEAPLAALAERLVAELPAELRPADRRRFSAHLTLARPRTPPRAAELAPLVEALKDRTFRFPAEAITVVESLLSPQGAIYREHGSAPLRS